MKIVTPTLVLAACVALVPAVGFAQRAPAYQDARAQGLVGEQTDGYLGFPTGPSAATRLIASDINIKRKAAYTRQAAAANSTVEEFAFVSACNLIAGTKAGEKYQAPNGQWQTRTGAAPTRDPRCP